jgi:hypothetical protein
MDKPGNLEEEILGINENLSKKLKLYGLYNIFCMTGIAIFLIGNREHLPVDYITPYNLAYDFIQPYLGQALMVAGVLIGEKADRIKF